MTLLGAKQAPYGPLRDTGHGGRVTSATLPMPLQAPVRLQLPWAYFDGACYSGLCGPAAMASSSWLQTDVKVACSLISQLAAAVLSHSKQLEPLTSAVQV